jgi:hypothetical protein
MVFWMVVILKIPIVGLLGIVWWAIKAEPEIEPERSDGDGGTRRHRHPRGRPPRPPRRGPHAEPPPHAPARVRARGKRLERAHA